MSAVTRYSMFGSTGWMEPTENGEYVAAADFEAVERQREELKKQCAELERKLDAVIAECPKGWLP